ncbi:mono/diheme cytochrome c family protein [Granulicella aggregans]|uniref:Mono/diheme cytochrome c family protein n=1 Tax=Granulicella aggregans TaxID=474949 RepID=A0A7W7ZB35_9BACT|nr:cytochrome c [Granulicella aggregans]MBB5056631.1 mono/diheme cytochrome c family protein [Granulicella aggregans]
MARKKGSSGGFGWGFLLGLVVTAAGAFAYFKFGMAPARVPEKPIPFERAAAPAALPPTAHTDVAIRTAPFGTSEDVFEAGAHIYKLRCASCHGTPGHDAAPARSTSPAARQLWKRHGGAVGVSGQEPGLIYAKIADGVPHSGMPAYASQLSETQIWQVSLLLKSAGQQLPDPVIGILKGSK